MGFTITLPARIAYQARRGHELPGLGVYCSSNGMATTQGGQPLNLHPGLSRTCAVEAHCGAKHCLLQQNGVVLPEDYSSSPACGQYFFLRDIVIPCLVPSMLRQRGKAEGLWPLL